MPLAKGRACSILPWLWNNDIYDLRNVVNNVGSYEQREFVFRADRRSDRSRSIAVVKTVTVPIGFPVGNLDPHKIMSEPPDF
jgi:hypothetical protein